MDRLWICETVPPKQQTGELKDSCYTFHGPDSLLACMISLCIENLTGCLSGVYGKALGAGGGEGWQEGVIKSFQSWLSGPDTTSLHQLQYP